MMLTRLKNMLTIRHALALAAAMLATLPGCTTNTRTYAGHTPEQVWSAMNIVAREPRYEDWKVLENNVWADEDGRRIEIDRILHRSLYRSGAKPIYEKWEWKMQVTMVQSDPPTVTFVSRGWAVPMHARRQSNTYFDDVAEVLGGARLAGPAATPPATATPPASASP